MYESNFDSKLHSGHLEELESVFLEVFEQLHEIELVVM